MGAAIGQPPSSLDKWALFGNVSHNIIHIIHNAEQIALGCPRTRFNLELACVVINRAIVWIEDIRALHHLAISFYHQVVGGYFPKILVVEHDTFQVTLKFLVDDVIKGPPPV